MVVPAAGLLAEAIESGAGPAVSRSCGDGTGSGACSQHWQLGHGRDSDSVGVDLCLFGFGEMQCRLVARHGDRPSLAVGLHQQAFGRELSGLHGSVAGVDVGRVGTGVALPAAGVLPGPVWLDAAGDGWGAGADACGDHGHDDHRQLFGRVHRWLAVGPGPASFRGRGLARLATRSAGPWRVAAGVDPEFQSGDGDSGGVVGVGFAGADRVVELGPGHAAASDAGVPQTVGTVGLSVGLGSAVPDVWSRAAARLWLAAPGRVGVGGVT